MDNFSTRYETLLGSVEQIDYCLQAKSLTGLLAAIKKLWACNALDDNELLAIISRLNQTPLVVDNFRLAGNWLPYCYNAASKTIQWLVPLGHATEPFHQETISRYRQQSLFNQVIQPCTSLDVVYRQAQGLVDVKPAGFIFHLSRCGSTLVSGCLSELESTSVFSESPLLTELLLDTGLSPAQKQNALRCFINLQAAVFPLRPQMIIKWNAWDIFNWDLICACYPHVPAIFLVRDPVEILASHQLSPGWHMSGDSRIVVNGLQAADAYQTLLHYRAHVMQKLMEAMAHKKLESDSSVRVVDYRNLDVATIPGVAHYFGLHPDGEAITKMMARMQKNSKNTEQRFVADSNRKQQYFTSVEQQHIRDALLPSYHHIISYVSTEGYLQYA